MGLLDSMQHNTKWLIHRYASEDDYAADKPYNVSEFKGNLLLNAGIGAVEDLLAGLAAPTAWNAANARIGVGDSSTAEAATQDALQAVTNKLWKGMEATFPSRSAQTVSWKSSFATTEANYAWNEFTIVNAADDTGINLNRKVSAQGTKTSGQVWTVTLQITLS